MIVVDSSVWIDAHRGPRGKTAATLTALLDDDLVELALPVRLELVAGVSRRDRAALERGLSSLPMLRPSSDTWSLIEQWLPIAAAKGLRFGLSDWLIAALAHEVDALIWSLDRDFEDLQTLKMARLYVADPLVSVQHRRRLQP